ncbi:conserved hypothetical protein [[Clostridium] ultunense Esp]|uniref:RsfA family transcriptional regulator n=1 Tax=Thermicanus aegyptius TaxID=94009 RepID=UPI0002B6F646|nr:RsfA family transcriptional regulator [Thermicanus aegyptius]CCQ96394.1 conserved hypothetical protein [[Clostridium] ultunense Esp]
MVANRQDAWTEEDDLLLAETVLRHIREGSTQLAAFEEVGEKMGRTAAACGFRWNSTVRKSYKEAIALAKIQRQKLKKSRVTIRRTFSLSDQEDETLADLNMEAVIRFLKDQKAVLQELTKKAHQLEGELKEKEREIGRLTEENKKMKEEYSSAKTVNDDYKTLLQIMERARKMVVLGEGQEETPVFKMDRNGNLERVL